MNVAGKLPRKPGSPKIKINSGAGGCLYNGVIINILTIRMLAPGVVAKVVWRK